MRKLAVLTLALFGLWTSAAQAHQVGRLPEKATLNQQAAFYTANAHHAQNYLKAWGDITAWQIVGHQHDIQTITPADVRYHQRLFANAMRSLHAVEQKLVYVLVPHYSSWLCIHHYEGAWNDSGDPYWGGLQMDRGFMTTYGSDMIRKYGGRYADAWTPLDQMIVAERAYNSGRGFSPWPNTAHYCGLI